MFSARYLLYFIIASGIDVFHVGYCLCGTSFRWSHSFNMDAVYGKWYGVGYARHSPFSKANDIGCVTIFITDITAQAKDDWVDWNVLTIPRRNHTGPRWRYSSNYRSSVSPKWSWQNNPLRRTKRNMYEQRHVQVIWDEDGQTIEQAYVYSPEAPGLWTTQKWTGIKVIHPDDPPRQPDVIRILKATPELLIINHCSDTDENGIITLVLRRFPAQVEGWLGYELDRELIELELPPIHKKAAICAACMNVSSGIFVAIYTTVQTLYFNIC